MKSISVGELRQNPTAMLEEVEKGAVYRITRHGHEIGRVTPPDPTPGLIPPKQTGPASTSSLLKIEPGGGASIDDVLEELRGEW